MISVREVGRSIALVPSPVGVGTAVEWVWSEVIGKFVDEDKRPKGTGGYYAFLEEGKRFPSVIAKVGDLPVDEQEVKMFFTLAREKCHRLALHPEHVSSFQSRDEGSGRFGGAVRVQGGRLAISGYDQDEDEGIALVAAMNGKWLTSDGAAEIARISNNRFYWDDLLPAYVRKLGR